MTMAHTGHDSRAVWAFPDPLPGPPVVTALPVDETDSTSPLTVVLEEATATGVTVRVWRARPLLGLGLLPAAPAGPGVTVHLTASVPGG